MHFDQQSMTFIRIVYDAKRSSMSSCSHPMSSLNVFHQSSQYFLFFKTTTTETPFCLSLALRKNQRVGRRAIYAILKQKPYNFTTNTLKAYLSAQASSLSAIVISKTHISGQKPRGKQLNAKVCGSESAIFVILCFFRQPKYLLTTHRGCSTKMIHTSARSAPDP